MNSQPEELDRLSARFRKFADSEARDSSPLYASLAARVAEDPDLLNIAALVPEGQPVANLLFGAVQYLLRPTGEQISSEFTEEQAFRIFRMTAVGRLPKIELILSNRFVQTNEVRRSIYLLPAFIRICQFFPGREFALVELGTSAGLNLLFDEYRFQFRRRPPFWESGFERRSPGYPTRPPQTAHDNDARQSNCFPDWNRLKPVDIGNEAEVEWLRSLIWPEHRDRAELLEEALAVRRESDVQVHAGDGVAMLRSIIEPLPVQVVPIVSHTHVANQLRAESRVELLRHIAGFGVTRDFVHLHNNIEPHLHATIWSGDARADLPLALVDGHARWVEWLDAWHS
jgi:hypothetical protein